MGVVDEEPTSKYVQGVLSAYATYMSYMGVPKYVSIKQKDS